MTDTPWTRFKAAIAGLWTRGLQEGEERSDATAAAPAAQPAPVEDAREVASPQRLSSASNAQSKKSRPTDAIDGLELIGRLTGLRGTARETRQQLEARHAELSGVDLRAELEALLSQVAIWFPQEACRDLPVLLPHVMRDNGCRKQLCDAGHLKSSGSGAGNPRDMWSTPTPEGFVRDDNSLIKTLVKGLSIKSSDPLLDGQTLGRNWVACHIWPMKAAPDPWLNSFVPNLVWLPKPVDQWSDRDGHAVQEILRSISLRRFSATATTQVSQELLHQLPAPHESAPATGVDHHEFILTGKWIGTRRQKIRVMGELLTAVSQSTAPQVTSGHSHYDSHVPDLQAAKVAPLAERLTRYVSAHGL